MKKLLLSLIVVTLLLTSTALASERLEVCQQALTDNSWKFTASSVEKSDATMKLIPEAYGVIQLPNTGIRLFESTAGQIYIVFMFDSQNEMSVAEIIFDQDMSSFILYSNGSAIMYDKE